MTSDYKHGSYRTHRNKSNQYAAAFGELHKDDAYSKRSRQSRMSEASGVNYLSHQLKQTASFDFASIDENSENIRNGANSRFNSMGTTKTTNTLEDSYSRAMQKMNRGDFDPNRKVTSDAEKGRFDDKNRSSRGSSKAESQSRHSNTSSKHTQMDNHSAHRRASKSKNSATTGKKKRSVSKKDPSEETIALFGANGVTGHYFLQQAMEAGYNIQALVTPGMPLEDFSNNERLNIVTGSLEEIEKIQAVVHNATYVVCLLQDNDQETMKPPVGNIEDEAANESYSFFNLNFVHNLVPILEQSKTCRVLLYEATSLAKDSKGNAPFLTTMTKKLAFGKNWRWNKKEQDRIVQYLAAQTENAAFNYIVTRPSATLIWDRPSRKKLAASKSKPGPFPITNIDLAEFTLNALRMEKVYNSCPYVVQDGI